MRRKQEEATEERELGGEAEEVEVEVVEENEWRLVEEACKNAETSRKRKEPSTNEKREEEALSSCSCSSSTSSSASSSSSSCSSSSSSSSASLLNSEPTPASQPTSVNTSISTPSLGPRSFSSAIFTPKPPPKLSPSIMHFFSPLSSSPKRQRTPKVIHVLDDPADGVVDYYPSFLSHQEATALFQELHEQCTWKQEEALLFRKTVKPKRLVSTQGEPGMSYSYAGTTKTVQCGWTELMRRAREKVLGLEQREGGGNGGEGEGRGGSGARYNFALLNYYADGKDYMGLHSDDETGLVPGSSIASISLGAERDFVFQHKQKEEAGGGGKRRKKTRTVKLGHGSLLVMKAPTQSHWKHALPQRMGVSTPRINITFRCVHQHASAP